MRAGPPSPGVDRARLNVAALGAALALAGLALGYVGTHSAPERGGAYASMTAPAVARYDEANDTTLLVPSCYYCSNHTGYLVRGDARDAAGDRVHLRAAGPDAWARVPIEPAPYGGRDGTLVTEAYAGPFEVVSPWPRLAMLTLAPALVVGGAWLALRGNPRSAAAAGAAALAGPAGVFATGLSGDGGIVLFLFGVPLAGFLAAGLYAFRRTRPYAALPPLALATAIWALVTVADAYFPAHPAI